MNRCTICDGKFKQTAKKHTIKTRHQAKNNLVIENLPVLQCTICGHIEIPEESQKVIEAIRLRIRREMEEDAKNASHNELTPVAHQQSDETPRKFLEETKEYFNKLKKRFDL